MPGPKPKSSITPIKTVRLSARGLHRDVLTLRKLLERHGTDPEMQGLVLPLRDQFLRCSREAREMAMFDVRMRRELAELQDVEYRLMNDEVLEELIQRVVRSRGYRLDSDTRGNLRARLRATGLGESLAESLLPPVPTRRERFTPSTYLNRAHDRLEAELDLARADVDEALACVEGGSSEEDDGDKAPEASAPPDEGKP